MKSVGTKLNESSFFSTKHNSLPQVDIFGNTTINRLLGNIKQQ